MGNTKRLTQEEFLQRCRIVHNNRYDYSLVKFTNTRGFIEIICPDHGKFSQQAKNHLHGHRCIQCGRNSQGDFLAISKEDFLKKAKERHGDKYFYPNLNIKRSTDEITITCKVHGDFVQNAGWHYNNGGGCKKCIYDDLKMSFDDFLKKANKVHNNKFTYPDNNFFEEEYVRAQCPKHGVFKQRKFSHINGAGCKKCFNEKNALSKEEFFRRIKKIHGDKYDYSKVNFSATNKDITIICRDHGEFEQRANSHMHGSGCYKCSIENSKITKEEFINRVKKLHQNKYDYSKINYQDADTRIEIVCPEHGSFWQRPRRHMMGRSCKKCNINVPKITLEEFIERAVKVHQNKYDYSKVNYIDFSTKVEIVCLSHGSFWQKPGKHTRKEEPQGCPRCGRGKNISSKEIKWLDMIGIPDDKDHRHVFLKIGDKIIIADGYVGSTNTVYELHGSYWHGDPRVFNPADINPNSKKTFGELHQKTIEKENLIKSGGYNLVTIWEKDFDQLIKKI